MGVAVGARKHFERHHGPVVLVAVEKERVGRHVGAGVEDEAGAGPAEDRRQRQPCRGQQRPRPHGDDDGIGLDHAAVDLDGGCVAAAARHRSRGLPQRGTVRVAPPA